jgi:hypothetical protein
MAGEKISEVVSAFTKGVKSGVSKTPLNMGPMNLTVDLGDSTEDKIDEVVENVRLMQVGLSNDFTTCVEKVTRDMKTTSQDIIKEVLVKTEEMADRIDDRWRLTQILIMVGMAGNALALLLTV